MSENESGERRLGDAVRIDGAYQYRAMHEGPSFQRSWHREKLLILDELTSAVRPGSRALDAGCGSGVLAEHLGSQGWTVVGVDANKDAVSFASEAYGSARVSFAHGYLDELQFGTEFDLVISFEVVEHLTHDQVNTFLGAAYSALRPGGRLILTTPNYSSAWPAIEWACDRMTFLPNMDGDQHITRFSIPSIGEALRRAGFEVDRTTTFSTLGPIAGLFSPRLQGRLSSAERRFGFRFGNLLLVVASRPAQHRVAEFYNC